MDKRGGSSGRALQIVPVARERRQRAIFAQPMPQLGPRRQQIQHVADQNGRGLVASDQKQYAEPVCGELLISPESAIRHTHARGLPAGGQRAWTDSRSWQVLRGYAGGWSGIVRPQTVAAISAQHLVEMRNRNLVYSRRSAFR